MKKSLIFKSANHGCKNISEKNYLFGPTKIKKYDSSSDILEGRQGCIKEVIEIILEDSIQ